MNLAAILEAHPLVGLIASVHGGVFLASTPGTLLRRRALERLGMLLFVVAFGLNTWLLAARWVEGGRPPFRTLFETMLFYPWCVGLVALVLVRLHGLRVLVPFASAISVVGLAFALLRPDADLVHLPPALQSVWFVPHVVTYFLAYAALFLSFVLAALALASPLLARLAPQRAGAPLGAGGAGLERHAHAAAVLGLAALTLGLLMGGVWAKYAWGDYWSWDPKESWALATWLAYTIYLHLRLMEGWRGRRAMWLLVASFGAVVFTYLGMSLLPTAAGSLHVYQ